MEKIKVLIDPDVLRNFVEEELEKIHTIEAPELAKKLGYKEGTVPILQVRLASLDDHLRAKELASASAMALIKIDKKIKDNQEIVAEDIDIGLMNEEYGPKTFFEINIFHRCVIEPKFRYRDVIQLAVVLPDLINRTVRFILELNTNGN